jgi:hypothetical protein
MTEDVGRPPAEPAEATTPAEVMTPAEPDEEPVVVQPEPPAPTAPRKPRSPSKPRAPRGDRASPKPEPDLAPVGRALALRLARLHLRTGSLALARAELESLAGGGLLDEPALLDLAEVRWRTGDLVGAGEAADAALGRGVQDPLAYVIAAEAIAAVGRPAEARRLAARAVEGSGGSLDTLFAGMPRSLVWPDDTVPDETVVAVVVGTAAHGRQADGFGPASPAAAEAFAGGRGALARGDVATAALRLGVAIRLEPGFAQGVLAAIGDRASTEPVLALVTGDALRLLGREHEALAAFDTARGKPQVATQPGPPEPEGLWPDSDLARD